MPTLATFRRPKYTRLVASARGLRLCTRLASMGGGRVVTEQPLAGPFVPAVDAQLVYEKDGFSVSASSAGRSILVLPVQYSRCM